ncbi:MAG: hypothetical protein RL134_748 [Actinomycetota bacterium]
MPVRSLADDLRGRSDDELGRLLAGRPDLLHPVPADMTALAARAGSAISTSRALDRLDGLTLAVACAVAEAEPCDTDSILAAFDAERAHDVAAALARLRELALVWGEDDALRLVRTARESLSGAGMERITWPPAPVETIARDAALVERTAGQHALATVMGVIALAEAWADEDAPAVLRKGGLGVRDLAAAARMLEVDERTAALCIETAYAAHLIGRDGEPEERWRPTHAYDDWHDATLAEQWLRLARAWWTSPRAPALIGAEANALSEEVERSGQPFLREQVVAVLDSLPCGCAPCDADAVVHAIDARAPRQASAKRSEQVRAVLDELEILGFTGGGALADMGRAAATDATDALEVVGAAMPAPLDHVLLQADLTAIAPGPLLPDIARELRLMADVESTGGAIVHRFSASSVRRALDAGRDAGDMLDFLGRVSRTPVPQPLTYLVEDAARRHGTVRVGIATAYIRCDDETALAVLLADPRSEQLGCVRVSPTVVTVSGRIEDAVAILRDLGLHPVAETPDGAVAHAPRRRARAPRRGAGAPVTRRNAGPTLITAAVATLRGGERTPPPHADPSLEAMPVAETLAVLRRAISTETPVRISVAEGEGLVDPLRLQAGVLTAVDRVTGEVRTYPVAQIQAADLAAHTP